jgi:integrase
MASPWPHPQNGIFYARLWVPVDLKQILKKNEVRRSLRTKDPQEAKRRFKQAVADIEAEWERLRAAGQFVIADEAVPEPRAISQREAHALAGEFYRTIIRENEDNPGTAESWERKLHGIQRLLPRAERMPSATAPFADERSYAFHPAKNAYHALGGEVRAFLNQRKDNLDANSFVQLCTMVALAKRDAFERLARHARGDYSSDPKASRFPTLEKNDSASGDAGGNNAQPLSCDELLSLWKNTPGIADKTYKSWSGKLKMLMKFAGKSDVAALTKLDVERWRDKRVADGISPTTVSLGDLAGVRSILGWAVQSTLVPSITVNVAADVKQKKGKRKSTGTKGFTLKEANTILGATLETASERMTETGAAARRWVPWICAYSGARVGEVGQLHADNVFEDETPDGDFIWCMRLTPEDGSIKTGEARIVPLHPHVLEQGFLNYVKKRKGKPLFYDPARGKGSELGHRQSDKVGERIAVWVRKLGIVRDVQPSHAWRHRFETLGRALDIRSDVVDSITGHTPDSTAAEYGDYLTQIKFNAIRKMPRYLSKPLRSAAVVDR